MTLKKLLVIVGSIIGCIALLMSVFNGINFFHVLTLTGMEPGLALFQTVIASLFSFFVYCFIGVIFSVVIGVFAMVFIAFITAVKKRTNASTTGTDAGSDSK
jgi:hypothetical protein